MAGRRDRAAARPVQRLPLREPDRARPNRHRRKPAALSDSPSSPAGRGQLCALILAHKLPALLGRLVRRLGAYGATSHVHVDLHTEIAPFRAACGEAAGFVPDRRRVVWGGYSVVEATLALIRHGLRHSHATHFLLLSGDSYPILGRAAFQDWLLTDADAIAIERVRPGSETHHRIAGTYLPDDRLGRLGTVPDLRRYVSADLVAKFAEIGRIHAMKAAGPFPWDYGKGSQWWCLRRATLIRALDVIEDNPECVDWFRYSAVPDEALMQTILLNFLPQQPRRPSPVLTLWDRSPRPYVFQTEADLALLRSGGLPLARKFTEASAPLLDALDTVL
jgi:hypothetical protein